MANYSDRDRECSSFADTCHCERSTIDEARERLVVSRLDRYELEDRHLRVLEELSSVKKLANEQSDKIKRLATKLMRFGANPRVCVDDQDRVVFLEAENSKLREKVCVLRNQVVNRKIFGRSPSRGRKLQLGSTTSGPNTGRSENSRLKSTHSSSCQCLSTPFSNDDQNYAIKVQELETEKKSMLQRIDELEHELASYASGNRREKVAENVEHIRVWRQMKRQNEKLEAAQTANEVLSEQIVQLKTNLEEALKNNEQIKETLKTERQHVAELDNNASKYRESISDVREKDELISDLTSEMDILKQHNRELLDLSSKFGRVEQENAEMKGRLSEQSIDHQSLKDQLNNEIANKQALEAANEQLLTKLNDLQKSVDVMSIQLMGQNNDRSTIAHQQRGVKSSTRSSQTSNNVQPETTESRESIGACKNCCGISFRKKGVQSIDKGIQANDERCSSNVSDKLTQTDAATTTTCAKSKDYYDNDHHNNDKFQLSRATDKSLTRENMLRLLEQVQIGSPMETQTTVNHHHHHHHQSRIRPSNLEAVLFGDS